MTCILVFGVTVTYGVITKGGGGGGGGGGEVSLYNSACVCVCVLYVTLSMRISVHNKSPELFTVKLESPSRQRVKHSAVSRSICATMVQFSLSPWFSFSPPPPPPFFPFLFAPSVFLPQFFSLSPPYPLPLPTPGDFFPHLKPKSVDFPRVSRSIG